MNDVTPGFSFKVMKLVVDYRMNMMLPCHMMSPCHMMLACHMMLTVSYDVTVSYDGVMSDVCVKQRRA